MSEAPRQRHYVCVYASQIAACIGANRHTKVHEAVKSAWQRISPAAFRDALQRNGIKTEDDMLHDILESREDVKALVDRSAAAASSSSDVASCYSNLLNELEGMTLEGHERQLVDAALRKNLYTGYGTRAEPEMLGRIADTMRIPCHADPTFYQKCMGDVNGTPWYIGGRIDALSDDGLLVVEIKNRVNRLFYKPPTYEVVQLQAYLELLDVQHGVLVECLKDAGGKVQMHAIPLARDKEYWVHEVTPKLERFVTFLLSLLDDTSLQDAFLTSKRPSAMVGL